MHLSSRGRCLVALTTALVAIFAIRAPVEADNWSGATGKSDCSSVNKTDNANQVYDYQNLTSADYNAIQWVRVNVIDPTDIDTSLVASSTPHTDVLVRDGAYVDYCGIDWYQPNDPDGGVVGLGRCLALVEGKLSCDQHELRMNTNFTSIASTYDVRSLACHESGHTLGLMHRPYYADPLEKHFTLSCMVTGYPKKSNTFDFHDGQHVNTNY